MIAAGQQFAAAVAADVVHLAFWSAAEGDWRLACTDELAQLQQQDPILSCATCIEVAGEEVASDPARVAVEGPGKIRHEVTYASGDCARELSTPYGGGCADRGNSNRTDHV